MKNGMEKFNFYLDKMEALLSEAEQQKSPGEYLYLNDARTIIFMLEGLGRLYAAMYLSKKLEKVRDHFKFLEDALGAIDYYDSFAKEFKENPDTPITVTAYLRTKMSEKMDDFFHLLIKEKWIGSKKGRLERIRKKLGEIKWQSEKSDISKTLEFYTDSIEDIKVLGLESLKGFTELEEEVHELRRKLRWLSIYPRALQGAVQLHDNPLTHGDMQQYLVPEIINSAFNKMPEAGSNEYLLMLNKNNFMALSWMISELGKIKDAGLKIYTLTEALEITEQKPSDWASQAACEMLKVDNEEIKNLLRKSSAIASAYFNGLYLSNLIYGISRNN